LSTLGGGVTPTVSPQYVSPRGGPTHYNPVPAFSFSPSPPHSTLLHKSTSPRLPSTRTTALESLKMPPASLVLAGPGTKTPQVFFFFSFFFAVALGPYLLQHLHKAPPPAHCPHGHPAFAVIPSVVRAQNTLRCARGNRHQRYYLHTRRSRPPPNLQMVSLGHPISLLALQLDSCRSSWQRCVHV